MTQGHVVTVGGEDLARRFYRTSPDNEHRSRGFALVNVLESEHFSRERIPGSTNIPAGHEMAFEARFDKDKEIVLYGTSDPSDASARAALELVRRGFRRVVHYEAGIQDWKRAGHPVAGTGRSW